MDITYTLKHFSSKTKTKTNPTPNRLPIRIRSIRVC